MIRWIIQENLSEDGPDEEQIKEAFRSISEPWSFIESKENEDSKWLREFHEKLKKQLK